MASSACSALRVSIAYHTVQITKLHEQLKHPLRSFDGTTACTGHSPSSSDSTRFSRPLGQESIQLSHPSRPCVSSLRGCSASCHLGGTQTPNKHTTARLLQHQQRPYFQLSAIYLRSSNNIPGLEKTLRLPINRAILQSSNQRFHTATDATLRHGPASNQHLLASTVRLPQDLA